MINLIDQLALKYGTDKSSAKHNYTEVYEFMLHRQRDKIECVLEFGVYKGQSLMMWADYFQRATVHGVDIRKQNYNTEGRDIHHHVFDCTTIAARQFVGLLNPGPDLVVDDAGHSMDSHVKTFEMVFPLLKSGAHYVIEDLHTCYVDVHGGFKGHPGYDDSGLADSMKKGKFGRTVDWLAELSHAVNFQADGDHPILERFPYFKNIKSIHFFKSLAWIVKK